MRHWQRNKNRRASLDKMIPYFWVWDNWLKNGLHTLDTLPFQNPHCTVKQFRWHDDLYMCVFTRSQTLQNIVTEKITQLFLADGRPAPKFYSMTRFTMWQSIAEQYP